MKIDGGLMTADLAQVGTHATHAEQLGYDGLWTAEAGHDPYLPCALAATATDHATIGTNIAVAFPRSPLVHAQVAWDLQALSRGRFVLGLGTQVKGHNERRYSTPLDGARPAAPRDDPPHPSTSGTSGRTGSARASRASTTSSA
jgi:alkanesulfonate monooxygenase SsuD/methylene tetrahydromethanopterin reductase-like flavin-dependent oxidoreductase (luciferase family)